jgi:hypothetical protein
VAAVFGTLLRHDGDPLTLGVEAVMIENQGGSRHVGVGSDGSLTDPG